MRVAAALAGASVSALCWAGPRLPFEPMLLGLALSAIAFQCLLGAPRRGRARHSAATHALTCAAFVAFGLPAAIIVAALRGAFSGVGRTPHDPAGVLVSLGAGTLAAAGAGVLAYAAAGASPFVMAALFVVGSALFEVALVALGTRGRRDNAARPSLARRTAYYVMLVSAFGAVGCMLGAALSSGAWYALAAFAGVALLLRARDLPTPDPVSDRMRFVTVELCRITRLRGI